MQRTGREPYPIVILTGAGISKESGLSTFRDEDGIWARFKIEDVATPEAFARDPDRVHSFYNARRDGMLDRTIQPNAAHKALARLERDWPAEVTVVTQNIDDLHERAGSRNLIHMHGEVLKARCERCGGVRAWLKEMDRNTVCPACGGAGGLRPHVVWFGEMPLMMDRIYELLAKCGLFLSIGTSGNVYPAAGFVEEVARHGTAQTMEVNLEPSEGASQFQHARYGPATETVPALVDEILTWTA